MHEMMCVGLVLLGHSAIMSVFEPDEVVTTEALRPLASVTSLQVAIREQT